jgi:hypothetical protein
VSESEPETPAERDAGGGAETPEEKRARVMRRLAEILRSDPPELSGSGAPVSAGSFPVLPNSASEFDQESAAELFAALGEFFQRHRRQAETEADADGPEKE